MFKRCIIVMEVLERGKSTVRIVIVRRRSQQNPTLEKTDHQFLDLHKLYIII